MSKPMVETVTLPDGTEATVTDRPEAWWTSQKASGYVRPSMLAPDPRQPRQSMDPERLAALHRSIAQSGVRETLVVTPLHLTPWADVEEQYKGCFFLIVSGHRRWNGTNLAEIGAIPIEVRIYKSRRDHHLDRSLLNKGRDDLTELDEGYEILNLREDGWKIDELTAHFGIAVPQLYNRINLTKLHPDIQQMLLPVPGERKKKPLPTTVAGILGGVKTPTSDELETLFEDLGEHSNHKRTEESFDGLDDDARRFELQRLLLGVVKRRNLSSEQAVEFIREQTLQLKASQGASGRKTQRYQPKRRKEILSNLLKDVTGSVVMDWTPTEFRRIFELASREEVAVYVKRLGVTAELLHGLCKVLAEIRDEKKEVSPEVRALIERVQGSRTKAEVAQ